MSEKIVLIGVEKWNAKLDKIKRLSREKLENTLEKTAVNIEAQAREHAPVDTGTLKASYHAEVDRDRLEATVSTDVLYAPFVEFGTIHQDPKPHFLPAVQNNVGIFYGEVKRAIKESMK